MFVGKNLHIVSCTVERSLEMSKDSWLKRRWHKDVYPSSDFFFLGDGSAQIPSIGATTRGYSSMLH